MGDSVEVQLARQDERWKMVADEMREAKLARKGQYEQIEALQTTVQLLSAKVSSVEAQLARANPTIDEFITIKHKVAGAGLAGKYLWAGGAALLTLLATSRENIKTLITWIMS